MVDTKDDIKISSVLTPSLALAVLFSLNRMRATTVKLFSVILLLVVISLVHNGMLYYHMFWFVCVSPCVTLD